MAGTSATIQRKMFKGLEASTGVPVYGYLESPNILKAIDGTAIRIIPGTACQYIGWADMNGEPIFEEDQVSYMEESEERGCFRNHIRQIHHMEEAAFMDDLIALFYYSKGMSHI